MTAGEVDGVGGIHGRFEVEEADRVRARGDQSNVLVVVHTAEGADVHQFAGRRQQQGSEGTEGEAGAVEVEVGDVACLALKGEEGEVRHVRVVGRVRDRDGPVFGVLVARRWLYRQAEVDGHRREQVARVDHEEQLGAVLGREESGTDATEGRCVANHEARRRLEEARGLALCVEGREVDADEALVRGEGVELRVTEHARRGGAGRERGRRRDRRARNLDEVASVGSTRREDGVAGPVEDVDQDGDQGAGIAHQELVFAGLGQVDLAGRGVARLVHRGAGPAAEVRVVADEGDASAQAADSVGAHVEERRAFDGDGEEVEVDIDDAVFVEVARLDAATEGDRAVGREFGDLGHRGFVERGVVGLGELTDIRHEGVVEGNALAGRHEVDGALGAGAGVDHAGAGLVVEDGVAGAEDRAIGDALGADLGGAGAAVELGNALAAHLDGAIATHEARDDLVGLAHASLDVEGGAFSADGVGWDACAVHENRSPSTLGAIVATTREGDGSRAGQESGKQ